jgi:hypothetical protein
MEITRVSPPPTAPGPATRWRWHRGCTPGTADSWSTIDSTTRQRHDHPFLPNFVAEEFLGE